MNNNFMMSLNIDLDNLASEIAYGEMDIDDIINFILNIDNMISDYGFTKKLVKKLKKTYEV